jgi:hypothetical protein
MLFPDLEKPTDKNIKKAYQRVMELPDPRRKNNG